MYNTMKNQAGNRLVISCQEEGSRFTKSSHYADIDEFIRQNPIEKLAWYQIAGQNKVMLKKCQLCSNKHFDGTYGNCGM